MSIFIFVIVEKNLKFRILSINKYLHLHKLKFLFHLIPIKSNCLSRMIELSIISYKSISCHREKYLRFKFFFK